MSWSNGVPANLTANPPTPAIASDTERIREVFGLRSNDLPQLRSAMDWLETNNPDGIITVQINLDKLDTNFAALEGIYSDEDYAIKTLDVVEIEIAERSTGNELLRRRYKEKIWAALNLSDYFCKEAYFGIHSATSGRS
jgi:hypothetical protein